MTGTGERSFFTRNRRGQPATKLMDEFVDGKPTGKIISSYSIVEGHVVPHYVGEDAGITMQEITQLRCGSKPRGRKLNPGVLPEEVIGRLDDGYIGVQRGLEYQASPAEVAAVVEAAKPVKRPDTATVLSPVIVAPHQQRVVIEQREDLTQVFVLEFDGPTGIERKEFTSANAAREYPAFLTSYYSRTLFSNFRLFREYRTPREELTLETK